MPMLSRLRIALAGAALGAAMAVGAGPALAETITYLLPAPLSLPAFGPFVLAKQRGYFKAEDLDVEFQVGKGGVDVAKQVGAGNAVIGGGIGDTPIIVRPNGVPVKAVAVLGGGALMQLVMDKDKGLDTVKDLKGKTITVLAYQDTTYFALLGMLASQGMTKDDVNAQAVGPVNVWKLFLAGQSDAFASTPDWTAQVMMAKKNIEVIPSDRLFKSMAQAIIASDETIRKNPQLIQRIVRATLKGMKDIMADPVAAAADFVKATPELAGKEDFVALSFKLYNQYVYGGQAVLGEMDESRLSALQDFYVKEGLVRSKTPVQDLYTNQFVK
ncbi:NitT/TauT family transport system substrate-binding protein [Enhydrobacter aerosaccus]|uniref:NitT/TauT family transport system substrate-binding protein n=1 Tax=Enhydrobacter aerosaccus TaxID=225324 RepID=A0A1T4T3G3_9HYPH|nr:ABC transporter substrate-binding protein [Enhydrobacter aerosaccus]SKA35035.1 NitT/TauT family transport system substrate-binding protein [Enhydrobacter aerosaccus]